jgi:hypothetical protein
MLPTSTSRTFAALIAAVALLGACGGDDDSTADTSTTTTSVAGTTTTAPAPAEQPAIWPAAGVVFETPEAAAEDFVTKLLGVPPELGEFQAGDARSGEIEVLSRGEDGTASPIVRSVLLLRQLGPDDGWFVLAAVNDNASITTPESGAEVAAGPLGVEGVGRGFEANVVVSASLAGDESAQFDQVVTQGGSGETPEPFAVELDLGDASPGDVVVLLVCGGAGLETDPGDFGAIPVVIAG